MRWVISVLAVATAAALSAQAPAGGRPSYKSVAARLPGLWQERYPVTVERFVPNPRRRGILRTTVEGRSVLYYQFEAIVARPLREADDSMSSGNRRKVEVWVRYRAWLKDKAWDISFVREDRLPGSDRKWIPAE